VPPTETPVPPTETPSPTPTVLGQDATKVPTATQVLPTATVLGSEATKVPTSTPSATELPKTGGPQEGSLALVGLMLALGGALAYRLASAQRPTAEDEESSSGIK